MSEEHRNDEILTKLAVIDERFANFSEKLDILVAMGQRVTALELWQASLVGKITIIVATVGILWTALVAFIIKKFA